MKYDELVDYIREAGCRVNVYRNKNVIYGGSRGTFDYNRHGPIICVAIRDVAAPQRVETLLHEFGHYLQWRDGFMQYLDNICDAYELEQQWINKKIELSNLELKTVRNTILTMEYDAELRGLLQGQTLQVEGFNKEFYLSGAIAYISAIKWTFVRRTETSDSPPRVKYAPKILTTKELYSELTQKQLRFLDKTFNFKPI